MFQIEFYHYPKQQDSCFEILEQMQDNGKGQIFYKDLPPPL